MRKPKAPKTQIAVKDMREKTAFQWYRMGVDYDR